MTQNTTFYDLCYTNVTLCKTESEWPLERVVSTVVPVFFGIIGLIGFMGNLLVIVGKLMYYNKKTKKPRERECAAIMAKNLIQFFLSMAGHKIFPMAIYYEIKFAIFGASLSPLFSLTNHFLFSVSLLYLCHCLVCLQFAH